MKKRVSKKKLSVFLITLSVLGIASFFILQKPTTSELTFKEHSLSAGKIGNVLPASCASNVSHFANDCDQICIRATNVLVNTRTHYDSGTNSCVCNNGKINPPFCDDPIDPKVILSPTLLSTVVPTITSFTADNTYLSYGGATYLRWSAYDATSCSGSWGQVGIPLSSSVYTGALRVDRTFTLTCYNGVKQASANVSITVETYADAGCGSNPCP